MMTAENLELLLLDSESDDSEIANIVLLYSASKKRKKSIWKSEYMKKRNTHGEFMLLSELSDSHLKKYCRLNKKQVTDLHELIKQDIKGLGCNAQQPIGTIEKLAICLRYLATGDTFRSIAFSYRMGERTVSKIVTDVCKALWKRLQPIYLPEPTVDMWKKIASEFETKWQFYNCLGTLDGKHITIRKPLSSGSSFFNYKQNCSIVLMATVDANYKFTTIDVGSMGRFSDANVFTNSGLGRKLYNNTLELPLPKPLPDQEANTPYVFVGDEAFPLLNNLMRPYPKRQVTNNYRHKVFNYRLSRARQTVECAFGILAARFRVYKRPFECKLDTVDDVVKATCVLHNYLRNQTISMKSQEDDDVELLINDTQLLPLPANRTRSANESFLIRQNFTEFFVSPVGSVSWQQKAVQRGRY